MEVTSGITSDIDLLVIDVLAQPNECSATSSRDGPPPDKVKDVIARIMATQEDQFLDFFKRWHQEQREKVESAIADCSQMVQGSCVSLDADDASRHKTENATLSEYGSLGRQGIQELPQSHTGSPDLVERLSAAIADCSQMVQGSCVSLDVDDASRHKAENGTLSEYGSPGREGIQELPQPHTGSPDLVEQRSAGVSGPLTKDNLKKEVQQLEFSSKLARDRVSLISSDISNIPTLHHGCLQTINVIVSHRLFELFSASIIFANAITIAYASDYAIKNLSSPVTPELQWAELCFCVVYTIELILRIIALGCRNYLCAVGTRWNRFDLMLVVLTLHDQLAEALRYPGINFSFLRVVRLLKMLRLLRMIRFMRMFRELRLIMHSLSGCAQSLFWSCIFIFIVVFMFAICFLQACATYFTEGHHRYADAMDKYWGSFSKAMFSLYLAGTNGEDWSDLSDPLWEVGAIYFFLFLFYIAFFQFIVLNILTSLFVEATREHSEKDIRGVICEEMKKKEDHIKRLTVLFDQIDVDGKGEITYSEFMLAMESPEMNAFAHCLAIEASDLEDFFDALSDGGARSIDLETFVVGCIKLTGSARNADIIDLIQMQKRADARIRNLTHSLTNIAKLSQEANDHLRSLPEIRGHLEPTICDHSRGQHDV